MREFPHVADNVVEIYAEVPWTGEDPRETAILLELPERGWTHIEFVESVRYGDRVAALFELDLLGRLVTGVEFHYQWRFTDTEGTNHFTPLAPGAHDRSKPPLAGGVRTRYQGLLVRSRTGVRAACIG